MKTSVLTFYFVILSPFAFLAWTAQVLGAEEPALIATVKEIRMSYLPDSPGPGATMIVQCPLEGDRTQRVLISPSGAFGETNLWRISTRQIIGVNDLSEELARELLVLSGKSAIGAWSTVTDEKDLHVIFTAKVRATADGDFLAAVVREVAEELETLRRLLRTQE